MAGFIGLDGEFIELSSTCATLPRCFWTEQRTNWIRQHMFVYLRPYQFTIKGWPC